jgi:hypothetical protein
MAFENQQLEAGKAALSQKIESAETPDLKEILKSRSADFLKAVSQFQAEFPLTKLESKEAQDYLKKGGERVLQYFTQLVDKGLEKQALALKMENVTQSLVSELKEQRAEINNFRLIEDVERGNGEIDQKAADVNEALKLKNQILRVLPVKVGASQELRDRIDREIRDSIADLTVLKADHILVKNAAAGLVDAEKLVAQYEKTPLPEILQKALAQLQKIDLQTLGDEIFDGKIGAGETPGESLLGRLYQKLWQEDFSEAKETFEGLQERLQAREKPIVNAQAGQVLEVVTKSWNQYILPEIEAYFKQNQFAENAQEFGKNILAKLFETAALITPYLEEAKKALLDFEIFRDLKAKFEEVQHSTKRMERNSEIKKNGKNFKELQRYVIFVEDPKSEKSYTFTPEFEKLPAEEQALIRYQIDARAVQNRKEAKAEILQASLESSKSEEKLQKLGELLGPKGQPYFQGLQKLEAGDGEGALTDFIRYKNQDFSAEERELHGFTLKDAQEKINQMLHEKLNELDRLFGDIKNLKYAQRKLAGSAELSADQGIEKEAIEQEFIAFRREVVEGKVDNFEARFQALQEGVRRTLAEQGRQETDLLQKLQKLYQTSQEKDPQKRKLGFMEFAKEAREAKAYHLARKFLDDALAEQYESAKKGLSKGQILEEMRSDPEFLKTLQTQAEKQYQVFLKENPGLKDTLTLQHVKNMLIERELDARYAQALRRDITPDFDQATLEKYDPPLALYRNWFPFEQKWYEPWNYGAEEWDEFQVECLKFAFEQLPGLGVGMAAGAAGKVGAKLGGMLGERAIKWLTKQGLKEAEILIIEKGGIQALKALKENFSWRALGFGASRFAPGFIGGVAFETGALYGLGLAQEYIETDTIQDFKTPGKIPAHLLQSMLKMTMYKMVGVAGEKIKLLKDIIEKGGLAGKAGWLASETIGGVGGAAVDVTFAKAEGQTMAGKDIFRSLLENYTTSMGVGIVHGRSGSKATNRLEEAEASAKREKLSVRESSEDSEKVSIRPRGLEHQGFVSGKEDTMIPDSPRSIRPPGSDKSPIFGHEATVSPRSIRPPDSDKKTFSGHEKTEAVGSAMEQPTRTEVIPREQKVEAAPKSGQERFEKAADLDPQAVHDSEILARKIKFLNEAALKNSLRSNFNKDGGNEVADVLKRLRERDPVGYNFLKNNLEKLSPECLLSVVEGNKREYIDKNGKKTTFYAGKKVAEGNMGELFEVAFSVDESTTLQHGVIKRSLPDAEDLPRKKIFETECGTAAQIQGWNSPYINKALSIDAENGYIIYETGNNPKTLTAEFENSSPREALSRFKEAILGVIDYQKQNRAHGDLKPGNILIMEGQDGKRKAQLIDNNTQDPEKAVFILKDDGIRPFSPAYTPNKDTLGDLALNPEENYRAVDAFALGVTLSDESGSLAVDTTKQEAEKNKPIEEKPKRKIIDILKERLTPEQFTEVENLAAQLKNPALSTKPGFLEDIAKQLDAIIAKVPDTIPAAQSRPIASDGTPTAAWNAAPTVQLNSGTTPLPNSGTLPLNQAVPLQGNSYPSNSGTMPLQQQRNPQKELNSPDKGEFPQAA